MITKKEAMLWIETSNGETDRWCIAPSGEKGKKPSCPKGFEVYDADPSYTGQKYWYIRKNNFCGARRISPVLPGQSCVHGLSVMAQ